MKLLIGLIFFISIQVLIILVSIINKKKNIFYQKIDYMKNKITRENIDTFFLKEEFSIKLKYNEFEILYFDEFYLQNYDYKKTVEEFDKSVPRLSKYKVITLSIMIISGIITFI